MTVVGERSRNGGRVAAEPISGGPAIGCMEDGAGGLAAARIAGSLARRLGRDGLLATVQQAHPRTPTGEDRTPAAVRHGRLLLGSTTEPTIVGAPAPVAVAPRG